jgi:flagellar motility protein MotE (MotC chaperone)
MIARLAVFLVSTALAASILASGLALVAGGGAPLRADEAIAEQTGARLTPQMGLDEERTNLEALLERLKERNTALDARERDLAERERQVARVQEELARELARLEQVRASVREERRSLEARTRPSFERLVKAYASMEPENASAALARLGADERETAVELLMALDARRAGQILDAMAALDARLAAFYTREIWERDPDTLRKQAQPAGLFGEAR